MRRHAKTEIGNSEQIVHFEVEDLPATRVCIAGTFNDWSQEATEMIPLGGGRWAKDIILPLGVYEYRLIVDGRWMSDPGCARSVSNAFGETNNVLIVGPVKPAVTNNAEL